MRPCYSRYFCIFSIFNFFQTIMVSLFLAGHDQYSIMFKDPNVFEFTNFPFKTKYNSTEYYSVNRNYLFSSIKQEKTIVETILRLNLMCIYKYSVKIRWLLKGALIHWRSIISLHKNYKKKTIRSSHHMCYAKKLFLKILQYSQENAHVGVSFKFSNTGVFLWILWNFKEHLIWRTSATGRFLYRI